MIFHASSDVKEHRYVFKMIESQDSQEVINSLMLAFHELFGLKSAFYMPLSADKKQLVYMTDQFYLENHRSITFNLTEFSHPFTAIYQENSADEIEKVKFMYWCNQDKNFANLMGNRGIFNGCAVIPLHQGERNFIGLIVIDLVEFRNVDFDVQWLNFFMKLSALFLQSLDRIRIYKEERYYLNQSLKSGNANQERSVIKSKIKENMIANSLEMDKIVSKIAMISDAAISVLLTGESGTGKTYVAKVIHQHSLRSKEPYIELNCEENAKEDLEAILFGNDGLISQVGHGTLFLDEISALPNEIQLKLAQVFLNGLYQDSNSEREKPFTGRVITSTREDIKELLKNRVIRSDFYARISQSVIALPKLVDRLSDFEHFVEKFIQKINKKLPTTEQIQGYTEGFLKHLFHYSWQGNLHELRSFIETKATIATDKILTATHLGLANGVSEKSLEEQIQDFVSRLMNGAEWGLNRVLNDIECEILKQSLDHCNGKRQLTSEKLGLPLRTLSYKCQKFGL